MSNFGPGIGMKTKERAMRLRLKAIEICAEADNLSLTTLRAFYNDDPKTEASTVRRVVEAIDRLEARKTKAKVAG